MLYHSLAWAYDFVAWVVSFGHWHDWRLAALDYIQPGTILEIGFGTGELLLEMKSRGYDITGLELSPQMHTVTRRKLKQRGLTVKRVRGRVEAVPIKEQAFANVISTFPARYILNENTFSEIRRLLKVSGRFVIVGLGVYFKSGIKRWLTRWALGGPYNEFINHFIAEAQKKRFKATLHEYEDEISLLPVLVLERDDGDGFA